MNLFDFMLKEEKEEILEGYLEKQLSKKKKIIIVIFIAIVFFILIGVFGVYSYKYFKSFDKQLVLGADIENAFVSENKQNIYIKLTEETKENITSEYNITDERNITIIKFILTDTENNKYVYELNKSMKNISIQLKGSFFDWLLKRKFYGDYDYEINASMFVLENFDNISKINITFGVMKPLPTYETPVIGGGSVSSGGGGSSGGGETSPTPCTDDTGCSSIGSFCNGNAPYNCTLGTDGCYDRVDLTGCAANETCINGSCVVILNCTSDNNCSYLNEVCGYGICNLTTAKCQQSFNISTEICRGAGDCDVEEYCTGNSGICPIDVFEPDYASCTSDLVDCTEDVCILGSCEHLANNSLCGINEFCDTILGCLSGCPDITGCQIINSSNSCYLMSQDIFQLLDTSCITIFADNVSLDCQGNSITSSSTAGIAGVYSNGSNTTIKNCNISNIVNGWGIYLNGAENAYISNNSLNINEFGVQVSFGKSNTLIGNTAQYNKVMGIYLYSSSNNTIINNRAKDNEVYGLDIAETTSVGNNITGNDFCLNQGGHDAWCDVAQIFNNNTCCCGAECGGLCLPCASTQTEVFDCQKLIMPNTIYIQMNDLVEYGALNCITIAAENITFNGQGYSITKSTSDAITAIYSDQNYTTIMNTNIDLGVSNTKHSITLTDARNFKLIDSKINNGWFSIYLYQSKNIEIRGNTITNSSSGIYDYYASNIKIINNTFRDIEGIGIQLTNVNDSLIDNNLIENCSDDGIYFDGFNNNITNNIIINSTNDGIQAVGSTRYNKIVNNTINYNAGNGIWFFGSGVRNNNMTNNTINHNAKNGTHTGNGLYLYYSLLNTLENNILNNNSKGIYFYNSGNNILINNTLNNNSLIGLYLFQSSNNDLINNTAENNFQYGIYVSTSSVNNEIDGNEFCSNNLDVYCAVNQTFTNNQCDLGSVCGGSCNSCGIPTLSLWTRIIDFFSNVFRFFN